MRTFLKLAALLLCAGPIAVLAQSVVLLAAGDIAHCESPGASYTGALIRDMPHPVLALGDLAYPNGSSADFERCYQPTWGGFKQRTHPAPGNHEYGTPGAAGYFDYFGERAGAPGKGYYSFDLGEWHIISLNSHVGVEPGSAQMQWLVEDLRTRRRPCTLAFWHHPRFSSGPHGDDLRMQPIWEQLQKYGVSVVLAAHDHDYERFKPLNAQGELDTQRGIRSFVVGTGGARLYALKQRHPMSETWHGASWGVLQLTLHAHHYEWQYLAATPTEFSDRGQAGCVPR